MTEEDIYRLFEIAYDSFDSEGNTPKTEELISEGSLRCIGGRIFSRRNRSDQRANPAEEPVNGYSAMARKFAEYHLRRTASQYHPNWRKR
jgi:hypothetical protein